jgi:UDP-N-acetylglucosamine 4-epimerase
MIQGETVTINGDGETSRDFCFIENAVQANLLAATANDAAKNQVYNVAVGDRTSLNQLFEMIRKALASQGVQYSKPAAYQDFRAGDVRHSQAAIDKARDKLGYQPQYTVSQGIDKAMPWYVASIG